MNTKDLFYKLKGVVASNPEKFFMNVSEFEGNLIAMFDYSLTIPADFATEWALEARGSLFQIDENHDHVKTLALPFEKFFNLHEYDFGSNEPLYNAVKEKYNIDVRSSDDVKALPVKHIYTKEDGSIITSFEMDGKMYTKSNSSVTSEYAAKGMELIQEDSDFEEKVRTLTMSSWNVIFEFTSDDPKYRIVLEYGKEELIVLAVRNSLTGEYMDHDQVISIFGDRAVKVHDKSLEEIFAEQYDATGIEGYIVETTSGLRYKVKTEWYVNIHRTKSHYFASPRNVWESFIANDLDDVYEVFSDEPDMKALLDRYVTVCNDLYSSIVHDGLHFYNQHNDLERPEYFKKIMEAKKSADSKMIMSLSYAASLKIKDQKDALDDLHDSLLIMKNMRKIGVTSLAV